MRREGSKLELDTGFQLVIPSPPKSSSRLPSHFATSFTYPGEDNGGPSVHSSPTKAPPSSQSSSPRKSPRTPKVRFPHLFDDAIGEDGDDDSFWRTHSRATSASKSKTRARARAASPATSDEEVPSNTSSPRKSRSPRKRIKRSRDDPNSASGSIYAHLKGLPDLFAEHNDIMFCGINPGVKSSSSGHHFAHRSNHFYPSLHLAGITAERMKPEQDIDFPTLSPLSLGLTNLAGRPTAEGNELLPSELISGVPVLLEKVKRWKPRTVCFVGKGISEAFMKGLRQAGAINDRSSRKKRRVPEAAHDNEGDASLNDFVKPEESEANLAAVPVKLESGGRITSFFVNAHVPSTVLSAEPASAPEQNDAEEPNGTLSTKASTPKAPSSPQKARRPLYTKDSAKDDTGYGLLPICVPHSRVSDRPLTLDHVTLFFVTPSSSARVTTHFLADKARILSSLRLLVEHLQTLPMIAEDCSGQLKPEPDSLRSLGGPTRLFRFEVVDVTRFEDAR